MADELKDLEVRIKTDESVKNVDALTTSLGNNSSAMRVNQGYLIEGGTVLDAFMRDIHGVSDKVNKNVNSVEALTTSLGDNSSAMRGNEAIMQQMAEANALYQRNLVALANMTNSATGAETELGRAIRDAKEETKAKESIMREYGATSKEVSIALKNLAQNEKDTSAAVKSSGAAHSGAIKGFRDSRSELRQYTRIAQESIGVHGGLSEIISSSTTPAFLAAGIAAVGIGKAVEMWAEEEKKLEAALESANKEVLESTRSIDRLRELHVELNDDMKETASAARRIQSLDMAKKYGETQEALAHLDTKQRIINLSTGEYGNTLRILAGPLTVVISLWARLTGKMEEYRQEEERLILAGKAITSDQSKELSDRAKFEEEAHRAHMASLGRRERLEEEHQERVAKIKLLAERSRQDPSKALADAEAVFKKEEAALAASSVRKNNTIEQSEAKRAAAHEKYIQLMNASDEKNNPVEQANKHAAGAIAAFKKMFTDHLISHEEFKAASIKIEQDRIGTIERINNDYWKKQEAMVRQRILAQAKADNDARTKSALADIAMIEQKDKIIRREEALTSAGRARQLAEERSHERKILTMYGATQQQIRKFDQQTHRMRMQQKAAEMAQNMAAVGAMTGAASEAFKSNKELAYAATVVNTAQAIMSAMAGPWPASIAFAIAAGIQGATQLSTISSQQGPSGQGQAHKGMIVPEDGSYMMNLKKNELFIPDTSGLGEVANALRGMATGSGGGGSNTYVTQYYGTVFDQQSADRQIAQANQRGRQSAGMSRRRA